jgi:hypothetical protein
MVMPISSRLIYNNSYPLGIAQRGYIEIINLAVVVFTTYLALGRGACWPCAAPAMT